MKLLVGLSVLTYSSLSENNKKVTKRIY